MRSILVSNLRNLGDVICSTAALSLLRDSFPHARIGLLVKAGVEEVVRGHPAIDDLFVFPDRGGSKFSRVRHMARTLRSHDYETYLSLDRKLRSAIVAKLAGIKYRITPSHMMGTKGEQIWMRFLCHKVIPFEVGCFETLVEMFLEPTRRAFNLSGSRQPSLPPLPQSARNRAAEILAAAAGRPAVGFSVKSNAATKDWLPERFAEVMDRLVENRDAFIYVTGAPSDREYIDSLLSVRRQGGAVNLAGQLGILDLAALAGSSDLFITLDTGAVHIVGNSGIKNLICIFTSTRPEIVLDSARQARVASSRENCCQCSKTPAECPASPCRLNLSVDMVYGQARELLGF